MADLTWGGFTLPAPDSEGIEVRIRTVGSQERAADGTLHTEIISRKAEINISWSFLSAQERDDLWLVYLGLFDEEATLVLPDGQSYSVVPELDGFHETEFWSYGTTPYYSVRITFLEV
jgi:hypothetical protein